MGKHKSDLFRAQDYLQAKYWPMWIFIGLLRLASLFPYRFQLKLGSLLGRLLQRLSGKRQHTVDTNLRMCFPEKSVEERDQIKHQSFQNLGISVLEMAMSWWWSDKRLKPLLIEVNGLQHIQQCLQNNQGVILLTGHFTSLEIGGALLAFHTPFQVMYRTQRNRLFDSLLYSKRVERFEEVISRKNTLKLIKGIKKGIPTWYAPDQDFGKERNVFAPFFAIPTATITATARLAKASGAAVLPYFPERRADGSGYTLWIDPPLENFPSGDDVADASAINASIEKYVRRHPDQYMWGHQRFKTRPPGEASFY